jgi:hypothetical protein
MNGTSYLVEAIAACAGGTVGILSGLVLAQAKTRRHRWQKSEPKDTGLRCPHARPVGKETK